MKLKLKFLLFGFLFSVAFIQAQVKIGNNPQDINAGSVLELESTSRALVITRVTTAQMNAITPLHGALVFNTDTQCVHFYTGTEWNNLCESSGSSDLTFTNNAIEHSFETIIITKNEENYNFEVGIINGDNIQFGTISDEHLAENSVGQEELLDSSVSTLEIQNQSILPVDIAPGNANQILVTDTNGVNVNWIDKPELATVADQTTIVGAGTTLSPLSIDNTILNNITTNTGNITTITNNLNTHIANDGDLDAGNEIQTLSQVLTEGNTTGGLTITGIPTPTLSLDAANKAYVDNAIGGSSQVIVSGNTGNVITPGTDGGAFLPSINDGDFSSTNEKISSITLNTSNQLVIIEGGNTITEDLSALARGQADGNTILGVGTSGDKFKVGNINASHITNATILAEDLNNMGATDKQILRWNNTSTTWEASNDGSHTGTPNSIFFADTGGSPTEDNAGFFWNPKGRKENGREYPAMGIGLDGALMSTDVKVHIAEGLGGRLSYPLMIQNSTGTDGSSVGMVFSVDKNPVKAYGKGALVYERTGGWALGDFHFLQNTTADYTNPTLADAVMTIKNDGNIGIGTTTPTNKLHVTGIIRAEGLLNSDGTEGLPSYRFNSDPNTGMFQGGTADQLGFSVGGIEALRIRDEGTTDSELIVNGSLELTEQLLDETGNTGNTGDILTATATGTVWEKPSVIVMGKANGSNSINVNGATISGGGGINTVNLATAIPDANYIIQLTVSGDNRIYVTSQNAGDFTVEIKRNSDDQLEVAEWYFTILNF